ncbi:DUF6230 family protein [Streptomyces lonarensis]|uniref:Cholesterol esterase n=1 Tax=Streptomyces lonarensis TaxID=700599 RepID=A0A7X6D3E3_9ACTN|nr:DUF6230 family protein [Streptomyces lonarensis]NJQ07445.1 cholesterol esterase [Streptomyces lonarensis]
MNSQARGGTRWRRFAVTMVPTVAATAAIGIAVSQGALAASFSVSGQEFKVSTPELVNTDGFVQYGGVVETPRGPRPVAVSAFNSATIKDLCQSVVIPTPIGNVSIKLNAGGDPRRPVEARNLFIDLNQVQADAEFTNMDIGVSVDATTKGPQPVGPTVPGSFAQQADRATLTDVEQTALATSAGTFKLNGLRMSVHRGTNECF